MKALVLAICAAGLLQGCGAAAFAIAVPAVIDLGLGGAAIHQRTEARKSLEKQTEEIKKLREEVYQLRLRMLTETSPRGPLNPEGKRP